MTSFLSFAHHPLDPDCSVQDDEMKQQQENARELSSEAKLGVQPLPLASYKLIPS